jgi:hypothetical protein
VTDAEQCTLDSAAQEANNAFKWLESAESSLLALIGNQLTVEAYKRADRGLKRVRVAKSMIGMVHVTLKGAAE